MRLDFAVATVAVASLTGCYGPMYQPPYGYAPPGAYGGYPGSMNTLTPGQPYVPGGTVVPNSTMPGGSFVPSNGGGNAPTYSPSVTPGNNSATRPAPTYDNPAADAAGGSELGMYESSPVLQRASGQTFASPQPMPLNGAAPLEPVNEFSTPTATNTNEFGDGTQAPIDSTYNKLVLPQLPPAYRPVSSPVRSPYLTPAY
jgi:hypothetical protein